MDLESQERPLLRGSLEEVKYVHEAEKEVRSGFVRKVYGILGLQLVLTTVIAGCIATQSLSWISAHRWLLTVGMVGSLAFILPLLCAPDLGRRWPWNSLLLAGFTASEGVCLGFVSGLYSLDSVLLAFGLTAGIFLSLTLLALVTKMDFTKFYPYLVGLTFALVVLGVVSMFFPTLRSLQTLYGAASAILFSVYIVADTQMIVGASSDRKFLVDDYVFAAIAVYLDIVNLFLALLRLLGRERRD